MKNKKNEVQKSAGRPAKKGRTKSRTISINDDREEKLVKKFGSLTKAVNLMADQLPDTPSKK